MRNSPATYFFQLLITIAILLFLTLATFSQNSENVHLESEKWADSVYNSLSLEEKIAQLIFARANHSGHEYIKEVGGYISKYNIGGVVFFKGDPVTQALKTNEWNAMAKTPLLVAIDEIGRAHV